MARPVHSLCSWAIVRAFIVAAAMGSCLVAASTAQAACAPAERRFATDAARIVADLRADRAAGAADAGAVLTRARRRCAATRFALAVASATRRAGVPEPGRRLRAANLDLIGVMTSGSVAWRLDLPRSLAHVGVGTTAARDAARARLEAAAFGSASVVWSDDPTAFSWSASRQVTMAGSLSGLGTSSDRALAGRTVAAFSTDTRRRPIVGSELLAALATTGALARVAAASSNDDARAATGQLARALYARVAGAQTPTWSKLDGSWSTGLQHRRLVARTRLLLTSHPDASTQSVVDRLAAALTTAPVVEFELVPDGSFYPWPADGAWDEQSARIAIDKPGSLRVGIYDPSTGTSNLVRMLELPAEPGSMDIAWNGRDASGAILPAGAYRWGIEAIDPVGNLNVLPGPGEFVIARDGDPPVIREATARYLISGGPRRFVVRWRLDEPLSPNVKTWLVVRRTPGWRRSMLLDRSASTRAMRRPLHLGRGTYRPILLFIDGSGNRRVRVLSEFRVR